MRADPWGRHALAPGLLCALLGACGGATPPRCDDVAVARNLTTLLRERVVRGELDTVATWRDPSVRARIEMATSVIVVDARETGRDAPSGKVLCSATIAIEGMGADLRSIVRSQTDVSYWIVPGGGDRFLVGLAYADLEAIAASYDRATSAAADRPSPR